MWFRPDDGFDALQERAPGVDARETAASPGSHWNTIPAREEGPSASGEAPPRHTPSPAFRTN
jgi:hypothetical protein